MDHTAKGGAGTLDHPSEAPPQAGLAVDRLSQEAPARPEPGAPATLLIVDDNDMNREVLNRFFTTSGYRVLEAEDGPQALQVVADNRIDLVMLDVMMPDVSGIDVLKALREKHPMTELPVIMATAKDQTEDVVEALGLGANDYVVKPLDFPVVLARVETHLSLKRAMTEISRLARKLELRNRFIRRTFGRYLSDEVADNLLEGPEALRLGGEKRTVTLLMSDLRGFTAMAERLPPEQVLRLLNNYLGGMADVIAKYQGTIDEFVGDAIMAIFGAPVDREDDLERAAACAVAMQLAMSEVNEKNHRDGLPEVEMGVAVNTGEVIVGNIGSERRTKYGVVGTNVNLTARIQSYTLGGQVLLSDATARGLAGATLKLGDRFTLHPKGFKEPIVVHELLGLGGDHKLELPQPPDVLLPLHEELRITFSVLQDKDVRGPGRQGRLLQASERSALVSAARGVAPLTNLRLRIRRPDGGELPGEVYAKAIGTGGAGGTFRIRFTSLPPEVSRFLQEQLVRP